MNELEYRYTQPEVLYKLKDFPHIQEKVYNLWQYPQALSNYLVNLMVETRENTRSGFPRELTDYLILWYNHLSSGLELPRDRPYEREFTNERKSL